MPTLHSHTHCQVAQADTQTKTWQRVCLSNRTADRPAGDRKEQRRHNSGFAIMAGEVRIQTFVQLIKFGGYRQFSVPNPPQRKAANR
jgi:hypothetical protein